jgi:hypothetical protein
MGSGAFALKDRSFHNLGQAGGECLVITPGRSRRSLWQRFQLLQHATSNDAQVFRLWQSTIDRGPA